MGIPTSTFVLLLRGGGLVSVSGPTNADRKDCGLMCERWTRMTWWHGSDRHRRRTLVCQSHRQAPRYRGRPLDEWWENWSTSANPQISPELVIAGRQDQAKRIARWFQDKPSHYYVQGHTREEAVQTIYTDLFSMFHRHQRLSENFEIVFGLGFLNWKSPDGQTVRRHLTVAHVSVEFDRESGTLTVTPAGEGARPIQAKGW